MIQHTIPANVGTMALERYIRRAWPMLPGHVVRDLLKRRDAKVNGIRCGQGTSVCAGDVLALYLPDKYLPGSVLLAFEDDRLLATVKPQGLPVDIDQDGIGADTLLTRLQAKHPTAQLCHRLDAATGGLVLAALNDTTHAAALEMFRVHALRKKYIALTRAGFDRREGVLRDWLVKDAKQSTVHVVHREVRGAKPIETHYRVLNEFDGIAQVELEPVTGRTHQLRAHMADFGHPLLGDDKYGDRTLNQKRNGPLRLWCAALEIGLESPLIDYRGMKFAAPMPTWWKEI